MIYKTRDGVDLSPFGGQRATMMDESPTRYMLPPEEGAVSYPTFESKKRKKKKTDAEKKKKKSKEEEFDPDAFLETLSKPPEEPPTTCPMCVIHPEEFLERRQTDTQYGRWEYYRCPVQGCFVCCGVDDRIHAQGEKDNVQYYLDSAQRQLHEFYHRLPVDNLKCFCERPLIMTLSHSENNPGRLFLKCSKRWCDFFQMGRSSPQGQKQNLVRRREKAMVGNPPQATEQSRV